MAELLISYIGLLTDRAPVYTGLTEAMKMRLRDRAMLNKLRCEVGHPQRTEGESDGDYIVRLNSIREDNVCATVRWLRFERMLGSGAYHGEMTVIRGGVEASGPRADVIHRMLEARTPLRFGMRAYARERKDADGILVHELLDVVTWDLVSEVP